MTSSVDYTEARAQAQADANRTGFDYGIEHFQLYKSPSRHDSWHVFMLPRRDCRFGHERLCEVVMCEDLAKCQPGHGPMALSSGPCTAPRDPA